MGLISRSKGKKNGAIDVKELSEMLRESQEKQQFFLFAIRALLFFVKDFSLAVKEIDADRFKKVIDGLTEEFVSEGKTKKIQSHFEKHKKIILAYIKRQKEYLNDRENEFKDIIDILTKAVASVDAENQYFNKKIYEQSDKIEKITLLDDIKKIKIALKQEVEQVRKTVKEKQENDRKKIEVLSKQVNSLNVDLEKAMEESLKDGLTGIYNRRAFDRYIMSLEERNTVTNSPFSLLILDIDKFKDINDTYGHAIGDRVLLALVQRCKEIIRSDDYLARYGGDEFIIALPGASLKNASKMAKRIWKAIAAASYSIDDVEEDRKFSFTVSIGVSAHKKGDTAVTVTERADKALYRAKHSGKGGVVTQ